MDFTVGMKVKVDKCGDCPTLVGKFATIKSFAKDGEVDGAVLNFGRGRPQTNRPAIVDLNDISLVKE